MFFNSIKKYNYAVPHLLLTLGFGFDSLQVNNCAFILWIFSPALSDFLTSFGRLQIFWHGRREGLIQARDLWTRRPQKNLSTYEALREKMSLPVLGKIQGFWDVCPCGSDTNRNKLNAGAIFRCSMTIPCTERKSERIFLFFIEKMLFSEIILLLPVFILATDLVVIFCEIFQFQKKTFFVMNYMTLVAKIDFYKFKDIMN